MWESAEGRIGIEYRGRAVRWREIPAPVNPSEPKAAHRGASTPTPPRTKRRWTPPADHPWREAARRQMERKGWADRGREADVVGLALRFALSARPSGSQGFAPGKAHGGKNRNKKPTEKAKNKTWGKGTFLKSFDMRE